MTRIHAVIGMIAALLVASACRPSDQRTIALIIAGGDTAAGAPVAVVGTVHHVVAAVPLMRQYVYQLRDPTGAMLVVSDSAAPCPGATVIVGGVVVGHDVLELGVFRFGPVLRETSRKHRPVQARRLPGHADCAE